MTLGQLVYLFSCIYTVIQDYISYHSTGSPKLTPFRRSPQAQIYLTNNCLVRLGKDHLERYSNQNAYTLSGLRICIIVKQLDIAVCFIFQGKRISAGPSFVSLKESSSPRSRQAGHYILCSRKIKSHTEANVYADR